jgi:hypothetical protein
MLPLLPLRRKLPRMEKDSLFFVFLGLWALVCLPAMLYLAWKLGKLLNGPENDARERA